MSSVKGPPLARARPDGMSVRPHSRHNWECSPGRENARLRPMKMLNEFKEFAMKGNVVDMAVGVVIGGAFGKIVSSFLTDVMMPPLGMLTGGVDFSDHRITLKSAEGAAKAVTVNYGVFLTTLIDFIIVAFAVFMMVKLMNSLKRQEPSAPPAATEKKCPECLSLIPVEAKRCRFCSQSVPVGA